MRQPPALLVGCLVLSVAASGVIKIFTMLEEISGQVITRVYDVRELSINLASERHRDLTRQQGADRIMFRVQGIDPLSWKDYGGKTGSIRELSGQLIVTHTPEMQRQIKQFLAHEYAARGLEFRDNESLKSTKAVGGHVDWTIDCYFAGPAAPSTAPSN